MKKKTLLFTFVLLLLGMSACDTDNLGINDPNSLSTLVEEFPKNESELLAGINATYSPLQSQGLFARWMHYVLDNMGQDNEVNADIAANLNQFYNFNISPDNSNVYTYWKNCYNGIFRANVLLDHVDNINKIETLSDADKNAHIGELRYLRAFYYFLLTSRFGDIPLYTSGDNGIEGFPKSPSEDVYKFIIADLTEASNLLLTKDVAEPGRVTKGAADALLGKVQLYRQDYSAAKTAFDKVIDSGQYELTANYFDNFTGETELNSESVFEVLFVFAGGAYSWNANDDSGFTESNIIAAEYGFKGFHNVNPANDLVAEFENGDIRKDESFYFPGDTYGANGDLIVTQEDIGDETAAWRKYMLTYKQDTDLTFFNFSDINFRVIRYADVLLMAAEAENELGNRATAISLMNQVRARVNMPLYGSAEMNATFPVSSKSEVFTAIVHERRVELAGEMVRFPDLVRWGLAAEVLPDFKVGVSEVLPIPQGEIDTNANLTNADQNSGY